MGLKELGNFHFCLVGAFSGFFLSFVFSWLFLKRFFAFVIAVKAYSPFSV